MDDVRLDWIKDVVCKYFQLKDPEAFDDLFQRDVDCAKVLYGFLTGASDRRSIFFYDTIVEEEVEIAVSSEDEEDEQSVVESDDHSKDDDENDEEEEEGEGDGEEERDGEEKGGNGEEEREGDGEEEGKEEGKEEEREGDGEEEEREGEEDTEIKESSEKKVMKQIVQKEVLNVCFNIIEDFPGRKYVYLLLRKMESIPFVETQTEAEEIMPDYFEICLINEHPLTTLMSTLSLVFLPIFNSKSSVLVAPKTEEELAEQELELARTETVKAITVFNYHAELIADELLKVSPFVSPQIPPGGVPEELSQDPFFVEEAEELLENWNSTLKELLQNILNNKPVVKNPYTEILFWKERRSELSVLSDHLNNPSMKFVLKVLDMVNCPKLDQFYANCHVIKQQLHQTNDNLNYLQNLEPYLKIQQIAKDCCSLAQEWKRSYLEQKDIIKGFEGFQHWYYNNKTLFDKTDFTIKICEDLINISKKLQQLNHVLKPELRTLSEDVESCEKLRQRIVQLLKHIQQVDFDIFEPANHALWENMVQFFQKRCSSIEKDAQLLIDDALEVDSNFENVMMLIRIFSESDIPKSVQNLIDNKQLEVFYRYIDTVQEIELQFITQKDRPLKYQEFPQFTSSIIWERHLLGKIKSPILIFRRDSNFETTERGRKIQETYLKVAKTFRKYETYKFDTWKVISDENIRTSLQSHLLTLGKINPYYYKTGEEMEKFKGTNLENMTYGVNFPPEFQDVMIDAGYLVHMGFKLPPKIGNFISQERTYIQFVKELDTAIHKVHSILGNLEYSEVKLLKKQVEKLCNAIDPGVQNLHWSSLIIHQFLAKVKQATDYFGSLAHQVQMLRKDTDEKIDSLKSAKLFHFKELENEDITLCQVFFETAEKRMRAEMEQHVTTYRSILPLLYKIESLTCNSSTGKAEPMREYYRQCEIRVLNALSEMVAENLDIFSLSLKAYIYPYFDALFNSDSKFVLISTKRAKQTFQNFLINSVKSTMMFRRWMDGTCIESAPQALDNNNGEAFIFSFYSDVQYNPEVCRLMSTINAKVKKYIDEIKK